MTNVVLYMRYSSDKQNEQSIEGQERVCAEFCRREGYTIVDKYVDRATSAFKDTDKRTKFLKMISDSAKGNFDAVVVYKLDRFSRNRYDSATYKAKLKKNGVKVISATENISDNPEGIILESVLEGMAEFYSMELSQKIKRGMTETALKCNSTGGVIPFGYKIEDHKFVIDEKTAPIVKEAFVRFADGERAIDIIDDFNRRGLKTSRGTEFNKNSFRRMFTNERYMGVFKYGELKIENGFPALVDKRTFLKVCQRMEDHKYAGSGKRKTKEVDYLLSGKLFCGECGNKMNGTFGTSKTGTKYYYYACKNKPQGCSKKNVKKEIIEKIVAEEVYKLLNPDTISKIAQIAVQTSERYIEGDSSYKELTSRLEETSKAISNLVSCLEGTGNSPTVLKRIKELEKQKEEIETEIFDISKDRFILSIEPIEWWLTQFLSGDIEDRNFQKRLIDMLVNTVTVYDNGDLDIIFNLTNEPHAKITAAELDKDTSTISSECYIESSPLRIYPNTKILRVHIEKGAEE